MRLIDADYARDKLLFGEAYISDELAEYIKRLFGELPAIEAEPVKRGRWVMKETMIRSPYAKNAYCSECLEETSYAYNYCPNCGAKMEREE